MRSYLFSPTAANNLWPACTSTYRPYWMSSMRPIGLHLCSPSLRTFEPKCNDFNVAHVCATTGLAFVNAFHSAGPTSGTRPEGPIDRPNRHRWSFSPLAVKTRYGRENVCYWPWKPLNGREKNVKLQLVPGTPVKTGYGLGTWPKMIEEAIALAPFDRWVPQGWQYFRQAGLHSNTCFWPKLESTRLVDNAGKLRQFVITGPQQWSAKRLHSSAISWNAHAITRASRDLCWSEANRKAVPTTLRQFARPVDYALKSHWQSRTNIWGGHGNNTPPSYLLAPLLCLKAATRFFWRRLTCSRACR